MKKKLSKGITALMLVFLLLPLKVHASGPAEEPEIAGMTEEEIRSWGISQLPETLGEAIEEFEKDTFLQQVLGKHIYTKYLAAKKKEWDLFRSQVTDWEIGEYLYKF